MIALLHREILVVGPCFSSLWIFLTSSFWPAKFFREISWQLPRPVPIRSTMLFDKVQTWGICLQGSISWPGGHGITWDLCVILFFLFLGICIFIALIIWNLLEMITTLRIDQQLTQTGYNQTNSQQVLECLKVVRVTAPPLP